MTFLPPETVIVDNENEPEKSPEPPRKKRWWLWLLLTVLLLGGGVLAWRMMSEGEQKPAAQNAQPPVPVKLATVESGTIEDRDEYVARLESRQAVTLQPQIMGRITKIFVNSGDEVKEGNAVMQIDSREQQAAVNSVDAAAQAARSQLQNAIATLKSLEAERLSNVADVNLNQQEYERYSSLAAQGAVSQQTRQQYVNKLASAKAKLNALDAQIQAQKASVNQAEKSLQQAQANTTQEQVQLQYYTVSAPIAGQVGDLTVKVGDVVSTTTQLTTITQNNPLQVEISIPQERAAELRKGMPIELVNNQGKILGRSQVFFISPNVNQNTQSILIKATFDNSNNQLRASEYVNARVIWQRRPGVFIPATSVVRLAGETFVYVAKKPDSSQQNPQYIAKQKRVKLGNIRGNNYQVIEGLRAGERIIVSGILNLRDGAPIMPDSK
ncbi:efflux RND transporter periplasmic adaptor subunit [Rivularia sp. UHCC 0363]|uniref:efflux RND transporter periplasmic adaptor subunit n=1 Tax=Rivularia sp. UHCC 0363 TaxID=3110244 RepID=UPI002B203A61|nr:efflux RND transporter periplasmic adaptor subunit [Rivularia sp. UHCC 0363]MEA5596012.1 efflux RND transporter periplasmic adaptor subunit [Rivularia sp. UHCC 0363]